MNNAFSKEEKKLFNSKDPKDYINRSLKLNIPQGRKAFVTKHWLDKTGYDVADLEYFRNRHPYWKSKKMEGTTERNIIRSYEHNYGNGQRKNWDDKLLQEFINLNKKDKNSNYIHKDWELAKRFKCTIASIQHLRRKFNMSEKILKTKGRVTNKKILDHLKLSENLLRKMKNSL
ncbi:MAG: hypothetical protein JW864_17465 [Spirochaetes bacterium]|nr:hypothetical protein [Spirochaetota bacterium]